MLERFVRAMTGTSRAMRRLGCSDSWWLGSPPKLQVFRSVIVASAIDVMDRFRGLQIATKFLFHYQAVFGDIIRLFESMGMVGHINPNIALAAPNPATSIIAWRVVSYFVVTMGKWVQFLSTEILELAIVITQWDGCPTPAGTNRILRNSA